MLELEIRKWFDLCGLGTTSAWNFSHILYQYHCAYAFLCAFDWKQRSISLVMEYANNVMIDL